MAVVTDSKSLEDAVQKTGYMKDKRCMVDIAALRQGMDEGEYVVCWRPGDEMLADPLTKARANKEALRDVLSSGECGVTFTRSK